MKHSSLVLTGWTNMSSYYWDEKCIYSAVIYLVCFSMDFLAEVSDEGQIEEFNITVQVCMDLGVKALNQILHLISFREGNVTMLLLLFIPLVRVMMGWQHGRHLYLYQQHLHMSWEEIGALYVSVWLGQLGDVCVMGWWSTTVVAGVGARDHFYMREKKTSN